MRYAVGAITLLGLFCFLAKAQAASVIFPPGGGTGIGMATTSDIGKVITVSSSDPFRYKFTATSSLFTETDPIWSAFLLNPIFTNLTSTNFFATNTLFINASSTNLFVSALTFTNANGTSITGTNGFFTNLGTTNFSATNGQFTSLTTTNLFVTNTQFVSASGTTITSTNSYFNNFYINTTTQLATVSLQGVPSLDLFKAVSSTGSQIFAIKPNGQVVVGPNDLLQTGALTIQSQPGNDITLSFTDAVSYTFQLGKVTGTSGQAFIGGPFGTALNLRAGGVDRVFIRNDTGYVGINSSTPSTQFVVVGTSTFNGAILQNGLTDCDASNQTVSYDLTTGQFGCGTDDNNEQRVGTSTANYFAFYSGATAVTGTPWVTFSNGALTVTTNTNFTIVSSTSGLFGNATTTNLHIAGMLKDWTASPGTAGDIYISNGTSTRWYTGGGTCNPYNQDNCGLVDQPTYFIVSGASGCPEGWVLYKDDSTYTCSPNFVYDYFSYATPRLVLNADLSFLAATGTSLYLSDFLSSTNIFADSITTNNLTINNNLTVNNMTVNDTLTVAASTTIDNEGVLTNRVVVKTYPENREGYNLTNVVTDPDVIQVGTPLSPVQAFYTDDTSRWLICSNTAGTGAVSLKNGTLAPNNTLQNAFYDNAGNLQTITAATLFGAGYQIRGCLTMHGQHVVLGVSTTVGVSIKITTSSPTNNIASAANWRTATFTAATPSTSVISIAGVSRATGSNTEYLQIVSSTTKIVPATWDFSVNPPTISPDNSLTCTTGGSATLQNTRAYNGGLVVGNAGAPFVTVYDGCGAQSYNGSFGASAPSLTGPDLAVTKCSIYSLNGSALYRHTGYNGCEEPQF